MTRARRWIRDLSLGVRLAFRGARTRTALTAAGIGLGVGVLLFAASLPGAISAREGRQSDRSVWGQFVPVAQATQDRRLPSDATALVADVTTIWKGARTSGTLIDPDGASPPVPPGLGQVPGPGEMVVSPALADLLAEPGTALLRERLGARRIVGTIAPEGLNGPGERFFYAGASLDASHLGGAGNLNRVSAFGSTEPDQPLDAFTRLLVLVGAVVLLFPIAILVATAARFGSERRDRRLAALRLVGTSRSETARIAAGESLAGALLGIAGGVLLFAGARQTLPHVEAYGFSLFPADVVPDPLLTAVILVGVLLVTIGATLVSMRRIAVEPLAVARRGRATRRRVWWRPLPTLAGYAVHAPLAGQAADAATEQLWQVGIGAVLVLVGIVAMLPWLVDAVVRRMRGWSVSSQLAVRTLQSDGAGSARIVSGVAVAVAGAIALQMLITISATEAPAKQREGTEHTATIVFADPSTERPDRLTAVQSLPGVTGVDRLRPREAQQHEVQVRLDSADPLALERLRTAAVRLDPLANVYESWEQSDAATTSAVRRVLMAGATILLMLITASLLVTTLEQLGERRRSLATLAAFGTPRAVLRRALWWQTAVPVAIGLAVAVVIGTGLGASLLALQGEPVQLDPLGTAALLAIGTGMVVGVTATALPLLRRVAAPSAMRTE